MRKDRLPRRALPQQSSWKQRESYVPARDNPQENVRPGADDHLKHKSAGAPT